jgi:hypothetical protein
MKKRNNKQKKKQRNSVARVSKGESEGREDQGPRLSKTEVGRDGSRGMVQHKAVQHVSWKDEDGKKTQKTGVDKRIGGIHTHTHNIYIKKTKRSCGSRVKESNRDQLIRTAKRAVPPQKEKDGLARGQP